MIHVLVADDEAIERRYLSTLFSKRPRSFQVVGEARNGREVLEQAARVRPDVIIMDINMPGLDGLSSAQQIKQQFPDTVIILNTAYAEFEFARKAIEYRLDAYLLKPAAEAVILTTVENCMRSKRPRVEASSAHAACVADSALRAAKDPIALVTQYIDENSHLNLNLAELADIAHFTPTYLSRVFHEKKGMTVTAYIMKKRLDNAKYLLHSSALDSQQIARECGFSSVSHFNRVFKQQTGVSPLEFRHRWAREEADACRK